MASKPTLSRTPEGIVPALLQHFNSMDVDIMCGFYEPDAILVSPDGTPNRGIAAIRAELLKYYSVQLPMVIIARHIFVADTIASLVLDWNIVGRTPAGEDVHMVGTANDIARRGTDGYWRYLIDNPFGTQVRGLA
ncbi:YybH family protein [Sphingomonas sp.]|uniref:YybH family protein n=1 Tax=Sphingomonas sp. TaxID=28214 RepID=UPI003B3BB984